MSSSFEQVVGSGAASRRLPGAELIRVTGADRVRFLDGMLTNDVERLAAGEAREALQLDRKGHVLALCSVLILDEEVLLVAEEGTGGPLFDALEKHVIADDVTLERLEDWEGLAFEGPGARAAAAALGTPAPEVGRFERVEWHGQALIWLGGGSLGPDGWRALGPSSALERLGPAAGLPDLADEAAEVLRIETGRPAWGADLSERNFPPGGAARGTNLVRQGLLSRPGDRGSHRVARLGQPPSGPAGGRGAASGRR